MLFYSEITNSSNAPEISMTMKEKMLAIIRGEKIDTIPFVQYYNINPNEQAWELVGKENLGLLKWTAVHKIISFDCFFESLDFEKNGIRGQKRFLHTPAGCLFEEVLFEKVICGASIKKHFLKEKRDFEIFLFYLKNITVVEDIERFVNDLKIVGNDGLVHLSVERTAYQQLWVQWVLIDDLCHYLVDYPELMEEIINQMNNIQRKIFLIVRNVAKQYPVPYVIFPDNITAPMIGEKYFRKYCVPMYNECAEILDDLNIPVGVHMDGDLKPLWNAIGESKVRVIDSMSVPPDNDTDVATAVSLWGENKILVNFPSSVHLKSADEIYEKAMEILKQGGKTGRIWIQISENMPPGVWKKSYPAIVKAIKDFCH